MVRNSPIAINASQQATPTLNISITRIGGVATCEASNDSRKHISNCWLHCKPEQFIHPDPLHYYVDSGQTATPISSDGALQVGEEWLQRLDETVKASQLDSFAKLIKYLCCTAQNPL